MPHKPGLLLLTIHRLHLVRITALLAGGDHALNLPRDGRRKGKVAGGEHGAIKVEGADVRSLERLVGAQPAGASDARDCGGDGEAGDDGGGRGEPHGPELA